MKRLIPDRERRRPQIDPATLKQIKKSETETYMHLFERLHGPLIPYYGSWTYDEPMVVTYERDRELSEMNRVLSKAGDYYVKHYREYTDLIPYEDKIMDILAYVESRPFKSGTARPDYIIDRNGALRICEITSRFFGNGYFLSFFNEMVGKYKSDAAGITDRGSYFEQMLAHLASKLAGRKKLYVLTSADKSDSIGLYVPFYHALGAETEIIQAGEVETRLSEFAGNMVVSALNQFDLLSYSAETLRYLADIGMINDFRTIFLLHDKRFFRLFAEPRFMDAALTADEADFLKSHTIETYLPKADPERFEYARTHKDEFILKHHCLGKSISVYAGCLVSEEEWESLFAGGETEKMILQPFVQQRIFEIYWETGGGTRTGKVSAPVLRAILNVVGKASDNVSGPEMNENGKVSDYVAGTILNVDGIYFGTGLFRTSSRPVINQADAHKISPVLTDQGEKFRKKFIL